MNFDLLFAVIAPREVEFFSNIADIYKKEYGLSSAFLTFYEPGDRILTAKGYKVFSLHKEIKGFKGNFTEADLKKLEIKYKLSNIRSILTHEKLTFNRFDEEKLLSKLISYDRYFDHILKNNRFKRIVQELGAFIAPISLYFNAMANGVDHTFIEPSMFSGYVLFNRNSLDVSLDENNGLSEKSELMAKDYINAYHCDKPIVIPSKDKHHFMDAGLKKLFNNRNIKRLSEKLYYKYVRGEKEEYNAISNHIKRNISMAARRRFLGKLYSKPDYNKKYVYFPLHVPIDFQLTFREPKYLNQLYLAEYFSNVLPRGINLYIKEHPASIGAYDYWVLRKILKSKNIRLIQPSVNSYDLIKHSLCVATINSKVGAEALLQGKKVFVLGSPYYLQSRNAVKLRSLEDFAKIDFSKIDPKDIRVDNDFFALVAENSSKGELYDNSRKNLNDFSNSLKKAVIL